MRSSSISGEVGDGRLPPSGVLVAVIPAVFSEHDHCNRL